MAEPDTSHPQADLLNAMFDTDRPRRKKRNLDWTSDLAECVIGEFVIVPLTTSRQLRAEGRAMRHCVGQYDEICHKGLARVFSIRDLSKKRMATISLLWRDDYWHLEQIKGRQNVDVLESESTFFDGNTTVTLLEPTELHFVSQEVLRRYRRAWSERLLASLTTYGRNPCGMPEPAPP